MYTVQLLHLNVESPKEQYWVLYFFSFL
nr:unnamed protein product [Callosobruchus chinensis]